MTGAAFAERNGVPVILATGYGELPSDETLAWIKLPKPFGLADLSRALATAHPLKV